MITGEPRLGLGPNWWQFSIYTAVTLLVGMTIGVERVSLPPLAHHAFGITSVLYTVSFISAFGAVKSAMNLVSGRLSDHHGRKALLVVGWAFAVPYAVIVIFADAWWQILLANLFLGVNQALTWSMSVTAKIDLVGPEGRGLAVGIDESAGYIGTGLGGLGAGLVVTSFGLRPAPYLLVLGVVALGSLVTLGPAKETLHFAHSESKTASRPELPSLRRLGGYMSWRDRSMMAVCQAGFFNKVADSLVAAFLPLYLAERGMSLLGIGVLVGIYAWVWGAGQVLAGLIADRIGRKIPIVLGTFLVSGGLAAFASFSSWIWWHLAAIVMGAGMALCYPNLMTAVGDTADPSWRGGALGVYRLWRDGGYAVGPLFLGAMAAFAGLAASLWVGAALLAISGLGLVLAMKETHPRLRVGSPEWVRHPDWLAGG